MSYKNAIKTREEHVKRLQEEATKVRYGEKEKYLDAIAFLKEEIKELKAEAKGKNLRFRR